MVGTAMAFGVNVPMIFAFALIGAATTSAVNTGSFAPYLPGLSKAEAPVAYWIILTLFLIALMGVAVSLVSRLMLAP